MTPPPARAPAARRIASVRIDAGPKSGGGYPCRWKGGNDVTLVVTFDGSAYPFERHCRHALPRDPDGERTFANMEFRESPPGLRVGPWPGWRGIPEMPAASVSSGRTATPLDYHWWGDELSQRRVRGVCRIAGRLDPDFLVAVQDPRLVPVQVDFYEAPSLEVIPAPVTLPAALANLHPRLLLRDEDLPRLRSGALPARKESLKRILSLLAWWDHPLLKTAESKIPAGPEGLTDEDRLLLSAYAARLFPTDENIRRALGAYRVYLRRTREPDFEPLSIDTQAGEVLFLLSVGYDWLHGDFSPHERKEAGKRLNEVADICWNHLGYRRRDYAQAHFLGCGLGLLAFALLFPDTHPRAPEWLAYLHAVLRRVLATLPPDGFFPHGLNMWIYETGFLLRWLELFRTAAGIDLWPGAGALAASSRFRAAATSPDGLCGVTMGDPQFRVGGDSWCHALIAARTGSRTSQWLSDVLRDLPVEGVDFRLAPARRRVYEHLWHDDELSPERRTESVSIFPDGGQAFLRTAGSLFTFRSGSPLGGHRYRTGITGAYGHADPCNGSFLLFDQGRLALAGPGPVYRRDSSLHNVVTIDGQGQVGDTAVWLPDFFPPEIVPPNPEFRAEGESLAMAADLAPAYLPHLGVILMQRSLLVLPGMCIAGADVVELDAIHSIEWNLHAGGAFTRGEEASGARWIVTGSGEPGLRVLLLDPDRVEWTTGETEFVPAYPHDGTRDFYLRCTARGRRVRFVWVILLPGEPDALPVMDGDALLRLADGRVIKFDGRWIHCRTGRETHT